MALLEDLNWRHSVKAYDPTKKVSTEDLNKILEAARLAPTSSGLQPFRVIVVENQDLKNKMVEGALTIKENLQRTNCRREFCPHRPSNLYCISIGHGASCRT